MPTVRVPDSRALSGANANWNCRSLFARRSEHSASRRTGVPARIFTEPTRTRIIVDAFRNAKRMGAVSSANCLAPGTSPIAEVRATRSKCRDAQIRVRRRWSARRCTKMILCEMAHTRCRVTRVIFDTGISGQVDPTGRTLDTGERHEDKLLWSCDRVLEASCEVPKPSSHQGRPKSYEGFERERPRSKWGVGSMKTRSTI